MKVGVGRRGGCQLELHNLSSEGAEINILKWGGKLALCALAEARSHEDKSKHTLIYYLPFIVKGKQ